MFLAKKRVQFMVTYVERLTKMCGKEIKLHDFANFVYDNNRIN